MAAGIAAIASIAGIAGMTNREALSNAIAPPNASPCTGLTGKPEESNRLTWVQGALKQALAQPLSLRPSGPRGLYRSGPIWRSVRIRPLKIIDY